MEITILEFIGDTGAWEWYEISRLDTPQEMIKRYARIEGLKTDGTWRDPDDKYWYPCNDIGVRAIQITIK